MRIPAFVLFALFILVAVATSVTMERQRHLGAGYIADAEGKLKAGQVYECVTSLVNINDEGWYTIVKTENKYFGLRFNEQPPIKGVVVNQEGKIVFLPLATCGVNIPNPLAEKDTGFPPVVIGGRSHPVSDQQ